MTTPPETTIRDQIKSNDAMEEEADEADEASPATAQREDPEDHHLEDDADGLKSNKQPIVSKNQLKRQRKWEQALAVKKRRKEQQKQAKIAKAKAEGRDIEAERKEMEENRKSGKGWERRNMLWRNNFENNGSKFQVCLDCSFEDKMLPKEVNSLASQLRYCYSNSKGAKHPIKTTITSLGGETLNCLQNVSGFDQWNNREFYHTSEPLEEVFPDKDKLVYLTSDSESILSELENDKVYVIGGIVDRNRLKRATIDRAESLGVATARLPISDYLNMVTTKVLTTNHVFEVLLKLKEHDNNWKNTLLSVLPSRKDLNPIDDKISK
jgi:tRNA (guanine9-N1)-methyltransferase